MHIHMATAFTVLLIFSSGRLIVTFACHAISPEVVSTYYPWLQFVAAKDQPLSISWSKSRQPRELDLIFKSCQPRRNDNTQSYHAIYGGRIPPKKRSHLVFCFLGAHQVSFNVGQLHEAEDYF